MKLVYRSLRFIAVTVWLFFLIRTTSQFVGGAAAKHLLIESAVILPLFPILGLRWLRSNEELVGWCLFTVWLGATYVSTGLTIEYVAFIVITAFAIAGYFVTPWFLVIPWFAHIAWDFLPRELPPLFVDLPVACLIFDSLIGAYLIHRINSGRWSSLIIKRVKVAD